METEVIEPRLTGISSSEAKAITELFKSLPTVRNAEIIYRPDNLYGYEYIPAIYFGPRMSERILIENYEDGLTLFTQQFERRTERFMMLRSSNGDEKAKYLEVDVIPFDEKSI